MGTQGTNNPQPEGPTGEDGPVFTSERLNELVRRQTEREKKDQEYRDKQLAFNKRLVQATWGLVIFGALGGGIAIWQASIAQQAADAATNAVSATKESYSLDHRAWVGPVEARTGEFAAGSYFRATVRIRNSGSSPAIDVENGYILQNIPKGQMPNFSNIWERSADGPRSKSVLQPDSVITVSPSTEEDGPLNVATVNVILTGEYTAFIYGEIRYVDILGDRHWTKWCYVYVPTRQPFSLCSFHNEVDQQNEHDSAHTPLDALGQPPVFGVLFQIRIPPRSAFTLGQSQ